MGLVDALVARIDSLIRSRLDVAISSRLAASAYAAPDNVGIGNIKAKTDLIPAAGPASAMSYTATRAAALDLLDAAISLVKAKTDLIPAAGPASATDYTAGRALKLDNLDAASSAIKSKTDLIPAAGPASATDYTAIRAAALDLLDAAISSRLAASAYTAPPSAASIWAAATRTLTSAPSVIKSIQSGFAYAPTTVGSGEDAVYRDVTITAVDTTKSVVLLQGTFVDSLFPRSMTARLTSGTNLRISSPNTTAPTGAARWTVVEFV